MIERPQYLKFLNEFKDTEFVKVITGVRRSGKTYLINMFIDELKKNGVKSQQIIHINFESMRFAQIKNAQDLYDYVIKQASPTQKNYLLFDEIQHVDEWEKAINSFRIDLDADIYVTGSNSHLLSGELATLL